MFPSFIKNLGIGVIADDKQLKVTNADLYQGREYIKYNDVLEPKVFKRLPFLQVSSIPGLISISEAMQGHDSVSRNDTLLLTNQNITTDIKTHEDAFNQLVSEYATLQQNLADSNLYRKMDTSVSAPILNKLAELKQRLIQHAQTINADMSNLTVTDATLKDHITAQQNQLTQYIHTLNTEGDLMETVDGLGEHTRLVRTTNQYHYLMWFIVLITFLSLFLYILTSDLVMNTLLVIIALLVIYLLANLLRNV